MRARAADRGTRRRSSVFVAMAAILTTGGCYLSHGRPGPGSVEPPDAGSPSARFVGRWAVFDTELRATSGGSVYEFAPDGTIALLDTWAIPAGGVSHVASGRSCEFGGRWWAADDDSLWLTSACTDGVERDVELRFVSDGATDGEGASVEVVSVSGESGWEPLAGVLRWAWARCDRGDPDRWYIAECLRTE